MALSDANGATESDAREAVELLASALLEPQEQRQAAADILGDPGEYLAYLLRLLPLPGQKLTAQGRVIDHKARGALRPPPPPREAEREKLLERVMDECHRCLQHGWPEVLLALLPRAIDVAELVAPRGGMHRGLFEALREVGAYFADEWAMVEFVPALSEPEGAVLDSGQAAISSALLRHLAAAAEVGDRPGMATRFLSSARRLSPPGRVTPDEAVAHAQLLAWESRLGADGGQYAVALVCAQELQGLTCAMHHEDQTIWVPIAVALHGRAMTALGQYGRARPLLDRALSMRDLPDQVSWRIDALADLYRACVEMGDFNQADDCDRRLRAVGQVRYTLQAEVHAVQLQQDDRRQARLVLEGALAGGEGTKLTLSALTRVVLRLLRMQLEQGDTAAAGNLYLSLMPIVERMDPDQPLLSQVDEVGAALAGHDGSTSGLSMLLRATARDVRCAPQLLAFSSALSRARTVDGFRRRTAAAVHVLVRDYADDNMRVGGVHALVMRQKGLNTALEKQCALQQPTSAARAAQLSQARSGLAEKRSEMAASLLDQCHGRDTQEAAAQALEEIEDIEWEVCRILGGLDVRDVIETPNPASIAMLLPPDSVYIDYFAYRPLSWGEREPSRRYAAFVLMSGMPTTYRALDIGEVDEVDKQLRRFRFEVLSDTSTGHHDGESPGNLLRRWLIDPLLPHIKNRTRLIISPDEALFTLPFECLPDAASGCLIDRYCVSYTYTSRSAMWMDSQVIHGEQHRASVTAPLVIGAPNYAESSPALGDSWPLRFEVLTAMAQEATEVAGALGVDPVLGPAAVKTAMRRSESPLIVHLASHAFVLPPSPYGGALPDLPLVRAGLAMAKANVGPEGILTAAETLSLPLSRTALVVLAACGTGMGAVQEGEGVASLGRAFDMAGAGAVVSSLWEVPDSLTRELMLRFYAHLLRGLGCAEALWQAKLEVKAYSPEVRDWGGFVSAGQWGSIALRAWTD